MLENLSAYTTNMINTTASYFTISPEELLQVIKKIGCIALEIFKISIAIWVNPYFSFAAVGVGLFFPVEIEPRLNRIWSVIDTHKRYSIPALIVCTVLHLPVAMLGYSLYIGLRLGSSIKHLDSGSSDGARQMPAEGATG